jgi:UDP-N-acetylmuramoyl-tripeptide--D-alanyl-D-alanine ligase
MMIQKIYDAFLKSRKIVTDTRNDVKGSIFFALKGENFNGNLFLQQALDNGAAWVVGDESGHCSHENCIIVNDSLATLQELSKHHRLRFNIPVIGITGSNGKTTTKELLTAVLSTKYKVVSTQGNLNNHIGVPLSLLAMGDDTEIAIIEMGANHPGEIELLCSFAQPTHGIITNIGKAHMEGFGNLKTILETKSALYRSVKKQEGIVFVPASQTSLMERSEGMKRIVYGNTADSDFKGSATEAFPKLIVRIHDNEMDICSRLTGTYNTDNILATVCAGLHFGIQAEEISRAISEYQPNNMRSQLMQTSRNTVILDAYNANPASMIAALENLEAASAEKKIAILGDMLELGGDASEEHRKILEKLSEMRLASRLVTGPVFSSLAPEYGITAFPDSETCREWLRAHPPCGALILVKGSRGIKMEKVSDRL